MGGPYPKYHLLICLYVCYSPGFFQEIQPGFQYCTLVITMCEPNQPLEQIKQDTPAGWVAKSGCWVVHAAFTTLKPETSTKRPPNRCPDVSGCGPLLKGKLCAIFDAFDFREVCQRMAARRARRTARQVKGQKTTEFHWLRPGASKVSLLGPCIRTKGPWSSWRV